MQSMIEVERNYISASDWMSWDLHRLAFSSVKKYLITARKWNKN